MGSEVAIDGVNGGFLVAMVFVEVEGCGRGSAYAGGGRSAACEACVGVARVSSSGADLPVVVLLVVQWGWGWLWIERFLCSATTSSGASSHLLLRR